MKPQLLLVFVFLAFAGGLLLLQKARTAIIFETVKGAPDWAGSDKAMSVDEKSAPQDSPRPRAKNGEVMIFPEQMTPEVARELMKTAGGRYPDVEDRMIYTSKLLGHLCSSGYTDEAWEMIEPHGLLRRGQMTEFLKRAEWDDEVLIGKILEEPADMGRYIGGYFRRFGPEELAAMVKEEKVARLIEGGVNSHEISRGIHSSLMLATPGRPQTEYIEVVRIAAELNEAGVLNAHGLYWFMRREKLGNAQERWALLHDLGHQGLLGESHEVFRKEMVRTMVAQNPEQAVELLMSGSSASKSDLAEAIEEWTRLDSDGMHAWYESRVEELFVEEQETVIPARFTVMLQSRDFDRAAGMVEKISDGDLRMKLAKQLDEAISAENKK